MKKVLALLAFTLMVGCGRSPEASLDTSGWSKSSDCASKNLCTPDLVGSAGYECKASRVDTLSDAGQAIPLNEYQGHSCIVTSVDYTVPADCGPGNYNGTCGGTWSGVAAYPCCVAVQGPGPSL